MQLPAAATTSGASTKAAWLLRIGLACVGLAISVPFLNFHHSYPLPTFYTEWSAFALGCIALLALAAPAASARLPYLSIGLFGLALVLVAQVAMGRIAYAERSLLGAGYVVWAALLVWLGADLRERCGVERLTLVLQACLALGGLLVAATGFLMYYDVALLGFRLVAGPGMEGTMFGAIGQRNNFANYLGCALVSVIFLYGRRRMGVVLAALCALPLLLALVLSTSRAGLLYVMLAPLAAFWAFRQGDRPKLRPLLVFALLTALVFLLANVALALRADPGAPAFSPGERWLDSFAPGAGQYGLKTRLYLLRESWAMFASHPLLGAGFGEFAWNIFEHGADPRGHGGAMATHAHNALLELLAETGLLGTLCVLLPLVAWLRAFRWSAPGLDGAWIMAILAIQALHSGLEFPLWHANFLGLTALLAGAAAQPGITFAFNRIRRGALLMVLSAGLFVTGVVLAEYRDFERWYRQADAAQRGGMALTEEQQLELARRRSASLFAGYYDLLASELLVLDRDRLDAKLELNSRVLRFAPIPSVALREVVLLGLGGDREAAAGMFSRLAALYPTQIPDSLNGLDRSARENSAELSGLAAEMRRRYGG